MQTEQFIVESVTEDDLIHVRMLENGDLFCLNWRQIIADLRKKNVDNPLVSQPFQVPQPTAKVLLQYSDDDRIANAKVDGPTFLRERMPLLTDPDGVNGNVKHFDAEYEESSIDYGEQFPLTQLSEEQIHPILENIYADALSIEPGNLDQLIDFIERKINKNEDVDIAPPSNGMQKR